MAEGCISQHRRDRKQEIAYWELLDLWDSVARVEQGQRPIERDGKALVKLHSTLGIVASFSEVVAAWREGRSPNSPGEIPQEWQMNYVDALREASELLDLSEEGMSAQELQNYFKGCGPEEVTVDAEKAGALSELVSRATLLCKSKI